MGLTLLKVCLALAMVVAAVHCEGHGHGPAGLRERAREGREGGREGGREHHREASPRDGPRTRREPPSPPRHHYGPGPPGPPSSGPRPSKSSASVYGPPHGHSHHGHAAHHHGPSSKPRYGPPPSSPSKHRKPVYGPKGKGKGHSHGHSHGLDSHSHGLDSYEATSTYDRPTRQSYGPSKSGYGHPTRGSSLGSSLGSGSSHKPHRPKATYSLSGVASAGGYGAPSKPSYGPPSKPSKPHSGNKYRKNKYRGQKPVYGPSKPFKPSSTFSSPPSATYSGASPSSAEYSPPSDHSVPSHLVNSYGEPASHGPSLASYSPGKVSSSLAHSAESSSGSVGSYEDTSYEPSYSSGGYGKPQQHGDGNTEIQPSISYTLLPTYGGGSTLSPDHKPSSSGGSYQDSYKPKTPYSYRAPYDGTSFKSPVSHGGAATSYISVNHPGGTAQPPASSGGSSSSSSEEASAYGYGSASSPAAAAVSPGASHGQAVLTTGYRAPDSSYEGTAHYASKPAAATYYSSIPAYGRQQGAGPSQSFRQQQQQQQQQYGDIQTAGSSLHAQQVQPAAPENFQAPAEVFGFVPYKSVAVSASVNAQGASAPIHVPSHPSHAANEVQQTAVQAAAPTQSTTPNFAGGLSPQDWDAYYGDSSKQAKPLQPQQPQQQSDVLSPNYYDPLPQQQEEHQQQHQQQQQPQHHQDAYGSKVSKHRHHSSNSRKKDTTQAHLKMLLQQRAQQQQQANKRYSQQAQVLAQQQQQQQQQQQRADARDSYATEEDAEEGEEGEDVEDARRR